MTLTMLLYSHTISVCMDHCISYMARLAYTLMTQAAIIHCTKPCFIDTTRIINTTDITVYTYCSCHAKLPAAWLEVKDYICYIIGSMHGMYSSDSTMSIFASNSRGACSIA